MGAPEKRGSIVGGWGCHGDFQGVDPWNRGSDREFYDRNSTFGQKDECRRKQERNSCELSAARGFFGQRVMWVVQHTQGLPTTTLLLCTLLVGERLLFLLESLHFLH